jgi:Ca-activated chloride channel homolog
MIGYQFHSSPPVPFFLSRSLPVIPVFLLLIGVAASWEPILLAADEHPGATITPLPRRPDQVELKSATIRADVNLVLIPVLVTDLYDRPVRGLSKEDFRLFEGPAEQKITHFFSQETPISIAVLFDASNSMHAKMDQTRQAVSEFLHMSTPGDEFFLLKFSDRPEAVGGFTRNADEIEDGVDSIRAGGWTSLFDAIYMGIEKMRFASQARKVLLVLSDGGDNNSRYTESEIRQRVKEADVRIFSISIGSASSTLEKISQDSGGRALHVRNADELPELASNLSAEIHSEYVLGYSPSDNQKDGKYRKVKVNLLQANPGAHLRTSWKRGYYGPGE